MSAVSQRIYVPLSLQALDQNINGYFQENRVRFCAFWNQGHGLDNMLLHHFTLKESMSGLINEGSRENDILVFFFNTLRLSRVSAHQLGYHIFPIWFVSFLYWYGNFN